MADALCKALRERIAVAAGRATVAALNLNNPYIVPARRLWVLAGWHSPDPHD